MYCIYIGGLHLHTPLSTPFAHTITCIWGWDSSSLTTERKLVCLQESTISCHEWGFYTWACMTIYECDKCCIWMCYHNTQLTWCVYVNDYTLPGGMWSQASLLHPVTKPRCCLYTCTLHVYNCCIMWLLCLHIDTLHTLTHTLTASCAFCTIPLCCV